MIYCIFFRLEQAKEAESKDALKDLVNLITSLTTYGVNELKPAGVTTGVPFLLPGFAVPQPAGKGECFLSSSIISVCLFFKYTQQNTEKLYIALTTCS